jgi:anti-sigma regulatory factor (Ser/Thr protein kinase)
MEVGRPQQILSLVNDTSHVGGARRQAVQLAENAGFGETESGRVALIATELANNLVRHAGGGRLLMQVIQNGQAKEIEVLSIDDGPGMNVDECLRDGFSSGGTAGEGLGAIKRQSQDFEIYSRPGNGTVVMARVSGPGDRLQPAARSPWRWGAVTVPAPGETAIGDTWRLLANGDDMCVMMADGLGHGPLASEAAETAAGVFESEVFGSLVSFFTRSHVLLRSTRGAAVAAALCPGTGTSMEFAGVGNISGSIVSRSRATRGLMSHNGTLGAQMRPVKTHKYDWVPGDRIVLHSDGLSARWSFKDYPDLMEYHPAILSALLFRDHVRGKDDATVLVLERAV